MNSMDNSAKSSLLFAGLVWVGIWTAIWLLGFAKMSFLYFLYCVPGLLLLIISVYDWRLGENMKAKQKFPVEGRYP